MISRKKVALKCLIKGKANILITGLKSVRFFMVRNEMSENWRLTGTEDPTTKNSWWDKGLPLIFII